MNLKSFSGSIGILGGGQLALMLVKAAQKLKLNVIVYSENDLPPTGLSNCEIVKGSFTNAAQLKSFFSKTDLVTIENEFLPFEEIAATSEKVSFLPTLETLEIAQNKLNQKYLFKKLKIPTSPFMSFDVRLENLEKWLKGVLEKFPSGSVLKWSHGGYDGKGNFVFKNTSQLNEAIKFAQNAKSIYAEDLINFKHELAMIFVRSINEEFVFYPLVISEQEKNICRTVYGPAIDFDIPKEFELKAAQIGKKIANELGFYGAFALEFFLTTENALLVNEMAPRVHNSGHYTQDAFEVDQFENHLRAITGNRLEAPNKKICFMMRNLLGPENLTMSLPNRDLGKEFPIPKDIKAHWYGKTNLVPWRKMGHLNLTFTNHSEVESKKKALIDAEQKIWQNLNSNLV